MTDGKAASAHTSASVRQHTLAGTFTIEGTGLHTGAPARAVFRPAPPGHGRRFVRADLSGAPELSTSDVDLNPGPGRTALVRGDVSAETVEHVLAALSGLGVDNVLIELHSTEPPVGDGSAREFAEAIRRTGVVEQDAPREVLVVEEPVVVDDDDGARLVAMPMRPGSPGAPLTSLGYSLAYDGSDLARGWFELSLSGDAFMRELAPARTFCMARDVERLRELGLGAGANHGNTLVIDGDRVVGNDLRFPDEPARHKVLDLVGDLGLLDAPLVARVHGFRSGHRQNRELVRRLVRSARRRPLESLFPGPVMRMPDILRILPHRYPFLLVDGVLELEPERRIVAVKNVAWNEEFPGPLPREPRDAGRAPGRGPGAGGGAPALAVREGRREDGSARRARPREDAPARRAGRQAAPERRGEEDPPHPRDMRGQGDGGRGRRRGGDAPLRAHTGPLRLRRRGRRRRRRRRDIIGTGGMRVHPTAVVDPRAKLADDVEVGPYSVIGPHVTMGPHGVVDNHVTIMGNTAIGSNCHIHSSSVIGGVPQDLKYKGEETELIIGDNNTIREFVTVNAGTVGGGRRTVIGDDNLLMAYVHIAHDCVLGDHVILANVATLGGHIRVEDGARISGLAAVHHFVTIGRLAFVGGCAKVVKDVPSFMTVDGNPARVRGLNIEGLKRWGIEREELAALKEAYRLLYRSDLNRSQAIEDLRARGLAESPATAELIRFLMNSERGRRGRGREAERSDVAPGGPADA